MTKIEYHSDNKYKYSIAMMIAYIKLCKPDCKFKINVKDLTFNLKYNSWENNIRPIDVLNDMNNEKYKYEVLRIKNANIKYPILLDSNYNIIDGMHRYAKHIINNKKTITVYIFDKKIMKKFIIGKRDQVVDLNIDDFIKIFSRRFSCEKI